MELYLVRHAESLANIGLAPNSNPDPRLSPRGIEQAEYLARRLRSVEFDKILVTNLSRAIQTAAIVGKEQKNSPPMIMDADFSERGTPVNYEADREFADTLYPNIIYEKTAIKTDYPGDLERIEVPLLKHIFRPAYQQTTHVSYEGENEIRTNPQKILLVAHACINACMFSRLVNSRFDMNVNLMQHNTCINRFRLFLHNGVPRVMLISYNDYSHLPESLQKPY